MVILLKWLLFVFISFGLDEEGRVYDEKPEGSTETCLSGAGFPPRRPKFTCFTKTRFLDVKKRRII